MRWVGVAFALAVGLPLLGVLVFTLVYVRF